MKLINFHVPYTPRVITLGNFDGVHLGHQSLLRHLVSVARQKQYSSCVLTFSNHPQDYFQHRAGEQNWNAQILSVRDKLEYLNELGVDECWLIKFDEKFAKLSAAGFLQEILIRKLNMKHFMVGDDFHFGANRGGDYHYLQQQSEALGFGLNKLATVSGNSSERISSTLIRQVLKTGDLTLASQLMGRTYAISGRVVRGRRLGRELNCPTLNIRFPYHKSAASGVFVVRVWGLTPHPLPGVASLGHRPTLDSQDINAGQILLETHCLNWPSELGTEGGYGKILKIEFLHKMRDEIKFDDLDALQAAIAQDCLESRNWFSKSIPSCSELL
ncbi:MAG: bifunctional riboflavin kinase/FAD synthetase [Gammaproteobacteria bacterium]|nr:bifunctional riboflavin kinase/FAD synthetase [Gammaproteobacteria bacterium]